MLELIAYILLCWIGLAILIGPFIAGFLKIANRHREDERKILPPSTVCPYDTDGDGDCAYCHNTPTGCPVKQASLLTRLHDQ